MTKETYCEKHGVNLVQNDFCALCARELPSSNQQASPEIGVVPDIDPSRLKAGLRDLSKAFVDGRQVHYGMRIPAEPYRDGDLVCGTAARLIERLEYERDVWRKKYEATVRRDETQPAEAKDKPGPWWTPTAEVERLMTWCKGANTITLEISTKVLEGLIYDSLLWRKDRAAQQMKPVETPRDDQLVADTIAQNTRLLSALTKVTESWVNGRRVLDGIPASIAQEAREALKLRPAVEPKRKRLRDSDAAFNLGVLSTEQPEKAGCSGDKT